MRVAYNDYDDRAGLRGYVQFNKYIHTKTHLGREQRPGDVARCPRGKVVQIAEQIVLVGRHKPADLVGHIAGVVHHDEAVGVRPGGLEARVLVVVRLALGQPSLVRALWNFHLLVEQRHQAVRLRVRE